MLELIGLLTIVGGFYIGIRKLTRQFDSWLVGIIDGAASR